VGPMLTDFEILLIRFGMGRPSPLISFGRLAGFIVVFVQSLPAGRAIGSVFPMLLQGLL